MAPVKRYIRLGISVVRRPFAHAFSELLMSLRTRPQRRVRTVVALSLSIIGGSPIAPTGVPKGDHVAKPNNANGD